MSTEFVNDRLTIKDIIFTKAVPNYKIPVPTDGYKIFPCTDCGDKFLFESSYNYHVNRKALKISYFCRYCMKVTTFYNRCNLLSHIRSHAFKTATITVTDLKIEPLPLEYFNLSILSNTNVDGTSENQNNQKKINVCYECNEIVNKHDVIYKDRAAHYMNYTKKSYSCPICLFLLPTVCALEAHIRIHLHIPPYLCPECGIHLPNKVTSYPFHHDCEGFKMMKAAMRLKCKFDNCRTIFHPEEYRTHLKHHLSKVYRCSFCLEVWYNEPQSKCTLCNNGNISSYIQCPLCPNKLFIESHVEKHLNCHRISLKEQVGDLVYPCLSCNLVFQHMFHLINHHVSQHSSSNLKNLLSKVLVKAKAGKSKKNQKCVYNRVIKKCSKCLRSFTYRCLYENIKKLPNECPYKCSTNNDGQDCREPNEENENLLMDCCLCHMKISQNWANIKTHYAVYHKNHKCVDIHVLVKKLDRKLITKYKNPAHKCDTALTKKKLKNKVAISNKEKDKNGDLKGISKDPNVCIICNCKCDSPQNLDAHMVTHRDPCVAYQCLECGQCFVVKPSFATHLLLEHGICDVDEYISKKPCYTEPALLKNQNVISSIEEEPVKENQCRICRDQFENSNDLEKHFRVHGMAFLMKTVHKTQDLNCIKTLVSYSEKRT